MAEEAGEADVRAEGHTGQFKGCCMMAGWLLNEGNVQTSMELLLKERLRGVIQMHSKSEKRAGFKFKTVLCRRFAQALTEPVQNLPMPQFKYAILSLLLALPSCS